MIFPNDATYDSAFYIFSHLRGCKFLLLVSLCAFSRVAEGFVIRSKSFSSTRHTAATYRKIDTCRLSSNLSDPQHESCTSLVSIEQQPATPSRRKFLQKVTATTLVVTAASSGLVPVDSTAWAASGTDDTAILNLPSLNLIPQFSTADDVPSDYFSDNRYIYGFVERIIDGDTIRVRHVPGYGLRRQSTQPLQQRGIAKDTLSIRVYGIDTPEIGKNKRQVSQPFSEEAKSFTSKLVYNKMVKVTFLRKDQYSRAVASVETVPPRFLSWIPGFGPKDLSLELAKAGLAELYTGGGAQYNVRLLRSFLFGRRLGCGSA